MSHVLLRSSERFADAVESLEHDWGHDRAAVLRSLEAWDEAGVLRPRFRVVLPASYAHYSAQCEHWRPVRVVSEEEVDLYQKIDQLLWSLTMSGDPEIPTVLEQPPPVLLPFVSRGGSDQKIDWETWRSEIGMANGRPIHREHAISYYGTSQKLRAYALFEAFSFKALLDPRKTASESIFSREWRKSLPERMLSWQGGASRALALVDQIEADGWLDTLYFAREIIHWGSLRVHDPKMCGWQEGVDLTRVERAKREDQRVIGRCRDLADRWSQQTFYESLHSLAELWFFATENFTAKLEETLRRDVDAAVEWAGFAHDRTREELASTVGRLGPAQRYTVLDAIYPAWSRDRRTAQMYLPDFVDAFNQTISVVRFDPEDVERFLTFLDDNRLWPWYVEFAAIAREHAQPTDIESVQRFLRLRSTAIMTEEILVTLAALHGSGEDRAQVKVRGAWDPMKVFLATRKDWRAVVWQAIASQKKLVSRVTHESLAGCLEQITALKPGTPDDGVVRLILAHVAIRNFGSHHIGRDNIHLDPLAAVKIRAVVLTPLFYWKIATTLDR
jgi:hypothetical protein